MITLEFPLFVSVTLSELLLPVFTFPKAKLVGLAPSSRVTITPAPLRLIPSGEFGALLTSDIEVVALVTAVGVNTALNVLLLPAARVNGVVNPFRVNPVPAKLA